jgi:hypothetical protein
VKPTATEPITAPAGYVLTDAGREALAKTHPEVMAEIAMGLRQGVTPDQIMTDDGDGEPCYEVAPAETIDFARSRHGLLAQIVVICGSTRFRAEIEAANRELTLAGHIVLAPGVFGHAGDEVTNVQKIALDVLHLEKIRLASAVYVVNPGGYVGESTRAEIRYAEQLGKPVSYLAVTAPEAAPVLRSVPDAPGDSEDATRTEVGR